MNLSASQLRRAATLQEKIEDMQQELAALLGGSGAAPSGRGRGRGRKAAAVTDEAKPAKRKSGISAAGRKRIAAAQKARWAKAKAEADSSEKKPAK